MSLRRRLPALTLLLALWAIPGAANAQPEPELNLTAYNNSSFDYCDAKILAAYWGELINDAKSTISGKIEVGGEPLVKAALEQAREKALASGTPTCNIYEMGYTAADAQALAGNWGYTLTEAKAAMFNKYLNVGEEGLIGALKASGAPSVAPKPAAPATPTDPMQAFLSGGMHYCDAKVLAAMWGTSVSNAKTSIGHKIIGGNTEMLAEALNSAYAKPDSPDCTWMEVRYDYDDAVAMAKVWGMDTDEAKARIARKVSFGNGELVDQMLMSAHAGN